MWPITAILGHSVYFKIFLRISRALKIRMSYLKHFLRLSIDWGVIARPHLKFTLCLDKYFVISCWNNKFLFFYFS